MQTWKKLDNVWAGHTYLNEENDIRALYRSIADMDEIEKGDIDHLVEELIIMYPSEASKLNNVIYMAEMSQTGLKLKLTPQEFNHKEFLKKHEEIFYELPEGGKLLDASKLLE